MKERNGTIVECNGTIVESNGTIVECNGTMLLQWKVGRTDIVMIM